MCRFVVVCALLVGAGCAGAGGPDTIITNAKVFTANSAQPWAEAIAITGERITAVGESNTIAGLAGSATRQIDAGGRTIIPGINDAHTHIPIAPIVVRDEAGILDEGRLVDYDHALANRRLAERTPPDDVIRQYRAYAVRAGTFGITTTQLIGDALPPQLASLALVASNTPMRWRYLRVPMVVDGETIDSRPILPPQPSGTVDMRGMTWFLDGRNGPLNLPQQRIDQFVGWAYGSEDPLAVHAIGEAAVDAYVSAVERGGLGEVWKEKRPRLEFLDAVTPDLVTRIKKINILVVQNRTQPMKSLLDAGIPLAIGSDGARNPFLNIMAAVTHPANPNEALTREQAVTAYTAGSAYAEFREKDKGQISVGMLADLAVLSADVFAVPVEQIEAIRSVMTFFGGRIVHDNGTIH